jgi:3-methyladenine DNA glycosylase/8-oxoguanine DNA glycosylase
VASSLTRQEIADTIVKRDRAFQKLIKLVGPPPVRRSAPVAQRFSTLTRSITYQLLATKAANTIHQRVIDLCDGSVSPEAITTTGHAQLRAAGLSNAKAAAMLDLAERTLDGRLLLAHHGKMKDHEVLADVVAVRGVGPWTAQMYLMHTLARHDVWPAGDFGVRNGWSSLHELDEMISEADLRRAGEVFAGVRSDVAWYCWRAIDLARAK